VTSSDAKRLVKGSRWANRERARQRLLTSLWRIAIGSLIAGLLFAVTGVGGGFGGPVYGPPVAQLTWLRVLEVVVASFLMMTGMSACRYGVAIWRLRARRCGVVGDASTATKQRGTKMRAWESGRDGVSGGIVR
jgi:hypothetical protein